MKPTQKDHPPLREEPAISGTVTTEPTDSILPEHPRLADDVQLIGEFDGPGFRDRQWLLTREGRFVQVTEVLYRVLEQADGTLNLDDLASKVGHTIDRGVSRENVEHLIQTKLVPMGLIVGADGRTPSRAPAPEFLRSPLQINLRVKVAGRRIEPIARALMFLHARIAMVLLLAAVALVHGWLFGIHGVIGPLKYLVANPDVMLIVLPIMLVASVFHEFGHASALHYEGGRVRSMGAGFVLVFPALYTDVTDGYRLSRKARIRIDLAGPYFHLLFGLAMAGMYLLTGETYWLILILFTDVEVGRQFLPIGRLDGYWAMADLSGIPDFFSRLVPFVVSLLPIPIPEEMRVPELTPRAKKVFVAYVLALLIGLPAFLIYILSHLPVLLATGWDAFTSQTDLFSAAVRTRDVPKALASGLQVLFLVVEAVGAGLFLYLITWRPAKKVWAWSQTRHEFLRRTTRGALFVIAGATAAIFGSLYPWRVFEVAGMGLARTFTGMESVAGRAVLIGGLCGLVAACAMILSWNLPLRRVAAWAALGLGLAGATVVAVELMMADGLTDAWIKTTIQESTGREPSASEFAAVSQQMSALGLSVRLAYGLGVVGIGSLLAVAGGSFAIMARTPSAESLEGTEADRGPAATATRPPRSRRVRALAAAVAAVAIGLAGAFIAFGVPTGDPAPQPAPRTRPESNLTLWSSGRSGLRDRLVEMSFPVLSEEALAFHTHQHLDVFVNGMQVRVPGGIGIDPELRFLTVLHTHGPDGVIHVEAPRRQTFTLGQFFDVWGVRLTSQCLGDYCGDGGDERVRVIVNGQLVRGDPSTLPLQDRDQIVVAFGSTTELPDRSIDVPPASGSGDEESDPARRNPPTAWRGVRP
jgi:putative peptide zinc metalloprotease protein